jgi:hypothetical protein
MSSRGLRLILAGSAALGTIDARVRTANVWPRAVAASSSRLMSSMSDLARVGGPALGSLGVAAGADAQAQLDLSTAERSELVRLRRELHHLRQQLPAQPADGSAFGPSGGGGGGELVLRVPAGFDVPDWWATASESETARALELLPPLLAFIGGQEDERFRTLLSLESRLAGVDEGARAAAHAATGAVEDAWRARVSALEAASEAARADRVMLGTAYEQRVRTLEAALTAARAAPDELIAGLRAAMASSQAESAAARAALGSAQRPRLSSARLPRPSRPRREAPRSCRRTRHHRCAPSPSRRPAPPARAAATCVSARPRSPCAQLSKHHTGVATA